MELRERFEGGMTYEEMVLTATSSADLYTNFRRRADVPVEFAQRIAATESSWSLLVLTEDWCGDSVNLLPWVDALASAAPNVEVRYLARDANLDLMDLHLTNGRSRSIPVVILLDSNFEERSWWGPRPREAQSWYWTEGQLLDKDERYKQLRSWYARDRGRSTLEEITVMIETAAAHRDQASDLAMRSSSLR